jgi:hypothetical protein
VQYLLLGLVLAILTTSAFAWMRMTGGDDGVADAELVDIFDPLDVDAPRDPTPPGWAARHAVMTVMSRRIPLIAVRRGPRTGQAWLQYADGTELLVEERVLGPLGFLAFDLALHGPTSKLSINPRTDDCWLSVGRKDTALRLIDAHHPQTLIDI